MSSAADEWDFTVPEDDAELLAELRRHGVAPGRRLHVSVSQDGTTEEQPGQGTRRHLSFAGIVATDADLSERTDEYLQGFGQQ